MDGSRGKWATRRTDGEKWKVVNGNRCEDKKGIRDYEVWQEARCSGGGQMRDGGGGSGETSDDEMERCR